MLRGVGGGLLLKAPTTEIPSLLGDIDNTICNTHTHTPSHSQESVDGSHESVFLNFLLG